MLCPVRNTARGRSLLAYRLLTLSIVLMLAVTGLASGASASRDRYEPPIAASPEPSPTVTRTPSPAATEAQATSLTSTTGDATSANAGVISAPAAEEKAAPQDNVRPRADARPIDASLTGPDATAEGEQELGVPRLDDDVLRWLPEIMAGATLSGMPPELIAGMIRLESTGNPNAISPVGARGLMQIMPDGLIAMGIPDYLWHDPATNIQAGSLGLAQRTAAYGSIEMGVGAYFGFGCDVWGTCTDTYIAVAFGWAAYYAPAIADPYHSGYNVLPADWIPPAINPFVVENPVPVETPPPYQPTPKPTTTATATPAPSQTPAPGETPVATTVPTQDPGAGTTPVPTAVPTEIPTEVVVPPTEIPTEIPTEPPPIPTEVPTEAPVAPPETTPESA